MEILNINTFIREGERYTREVFPDLDGTDLLSSAVAGRIDNGNILSNLLNIFGREIVSSITLLGSILVIIVVHSILKSLTENVGNESISEIAYYIQYILIVALIMTSFTGVIMTIRETINHLVGLMSTLVPILLALTMATGNIASATFLEPLILLAIIIIGNFITTFILPIVFVANALGIVSNISNRVQIGRLSKFFKSGIAWLLGFIIVVFTSVLSLQGTLTSNVDGIASKSIRSAASTFIPVVGKALRRFYRFSTSGPGLY